MKMIFFLFLALWVFLPIHVMASAPETSAKQAIIVDFETGAVLLSKNESQKMPTSSMSKVMTMYMVFDALKSGQIALNDELTVSEKAWRKGGSKMFVEVGKQVRVEDLVKGVIVQSGNDATIVLAEGLAGSEDGFAQLMNRKARELGMADSQFVNASGWPDPNHFSTAKDLSVLGREIIRNFPDYYHYYSLKEYTFNDITQANRNPLLYRNIGADGIKTGHTEAGGYGLIGSAISPQGRRVVMVLNGLDSAADRAQESARLIEWALRTFENHKILSAHETVETLPVVMGQSKAVAVSAANDVTVTVPSALKGDVTITLAAKAPLVAPVQKGDVVGELIISAPGLPTETRPLLAAQSVDELGFFSKTLAKAGQFFSRKAESVYAE